MTARILSPPYSRANGSRHALSWSRWPATFRTNVRGWSAAPARGVRFSASPCDTGGLIDRLVCPRTANPRRNIMLRHPLRHLAVAFLCFAAAAPAVAQNLVKNGRFLTDTSFWNSAFARNPNDADGWPGSGSLQISNNLPDPNYGLAVAQVGPVRPGELLIRAKAFIPAGQSRTGYASVFVNAYAAADCTGSSLANKSIGTSPALGSWVTVQ